jgi:DNA-binding NarL/FixJ family response regulator
MLKDGLKILIVEDSILIRDKVIMILSELNCISIIVNSGNGIEAMNLVQEQNPDVILLDINLPGKSGLSILKEIKQQSNATVVMLTNYSDEYYRSLCSRLGADHFLDKSIEFEKIPPRLPIFIVKLFSVIVSMTRQYSF